MSFSDPAYTELTRVLKDAYNQAARGKGKERHAEKDEPFEKQQICEIARRLKDNRAAGPLFQAVKKIYESGRLPTERAIAELYGAINYTAAAILMFEESPCVNGMKQHEFYDLRLCDVSTAHITEQDNNLLSIVTDNAEHRGFESIVVYRHEHGFFIYLDDCLSDNSEGYVDSLRKEKYSADFIQLLIDAKNAGFGWMKLDCDAPTYKDRKTFDW